MFNGINQRVICRRIYDFTFVSIEMHKVIMVKQHDNAINNVIAGAILSTLSKQILSGDVTDNKQKPNLPNHFS